MGENLIIVESPAKAKTIEKFLGKEYTVKSSFGHICDLAKKKIWELTLNTALNQSMKFPQTRKKLSLN